MKTFYVVYVVKGRQDDRIFQADTSAEARMMIKLDYPDAVIKSVKVIA